MTETLDEKGQVAGVTRTETRTTLVTVDARGYSLRIESTVEVAGKKFTSQPQVVKHGYYGEPAGQTVEVKKIGTADLEIDGRTVASDVRQATFESDGVETRTSTIPFRRHFAVPIAARNRHRSCDGETSAARRSSKRSPSTCHKRYMAKCDRRRT